MTDLGPDARSFLDAVRDADDPSATDAARIRTGIALRLGAAAAAGTAATLGAKSASAGGAMASGAGAASVATAANGGALATKIVVALAFVSTVGVSAVALRANAPPRPPAVSAAASSTSTHDEPPATRPPPVAVDDGAVEPADLPTPPAAVAERSVPHAAAPSASAKTTATPARVAPAAPDRLFEEAALIRAANTALSSGDSATCLARLDDHAARFPHGALSEERSATRVHALCAAGRVTEARTAASAFVAAHPRSALAPAVRRSCTTD